MAVAEVVDAAAVEAIDTAAVEVVTIMDTAAEEEEAEIVGERDSGFGDSVIEFPAALK
jgi:hypothetical protein